MAYILHKQLGGSTQNTSSQNDGTQAFDPSAWKGCFKFRKDNLENKKKKTKQNTTTNKPKIHKKTHKKKEPTLFPYAMRQLSSHLLCFC